MDHHEFADIVEQLMANPDLDTVVARQLLVAIAADTRARSAELHSISDQNIKLLEHLIQQQSANIDKLTTDVAKLTDYLDQHPPLIYLLRFRTKETIAAIVILFLIASVWYVSGIRQPILKWLGLPVF